jgi:DUF971 family protein
MDTTPDKITVDHDQRAVTITWKDGHVSALSFNLLRKQCPCATCTEERKNTNPLKLMTGPMPKEVGLVRVDPMGRYALSLAFSDGHDTGIYTYEFLRGLCRCADCSGGPVKS